MKCYITLQSISLKLGFAYLLYFPLPRKVRSIMSTTVNYRHVLLEKESLFIIMLKRIFSSAKTKTFTHLDVISRTERKLLKNTAQYRRRLHQYHPKS